MKMNCIASGTLQATGPGTKEKPYVTHYGERSVVVSVEGMHWRAAREDSTYVAE
jgi:hypothetical protein